jgi:phosphopantothenoylcysteine decarboxylase/phosphopantothenate--cysteine ligase
MRNKRILLIIGGGIAAYKACELVRLIRKAGGDVTCVLTKSGAEFVTPMSLAALSGNQVHTSLWDMKDETEIGHIELSRQADLLVVAPATADLLAKMAAGIANDLATTLLLATDKQVLAAPAMNVRMWQHEATQRNIEQLRRDGIQILPPDEGEMACGEFGPGRLPEPETILAAIQDYFGEGSMRLAGKHIIVTAGPTHEPIDPVRMIANRSSGKQGFAIAEALATLGADVTLIAGPVVLNTPDGVNRINIVTAAEMGEALQRALPADAAVLVAAVADWRVDPASQKIKKGQMPALTLIENPDLLAGLATSKKRPKLLIGFAAETDNVIENARLKLARKGCDWIIANDVSGDVMGGDSNSVHLVSAEGVETWDRTSKRDIARQLALRIANALD